MTLNQSPTLFRYYRLRNSFQWRHCERRPAFRESNPASVSNKSVSADSPSELLRLTPASPRSMSGQPVSAPGAKGGQQPFGHLDEWDTSRRTQRVCGWPPWRAAGCLAWGSAGCSDPPLCLSFFTGFLSYLVFVCWLFADGIFVFAYHFVITQNGFN